MSMKKRTLSLLLAAVMVASMGLTACKDKVVSTPSSDATGSGTSGDTSSKAPATKVIYPGTPEAGTIVTNIRTEPPELFSVTTTDTVSLNVLRHLSDGLLILDKEDKPMAAVAKDWTISEDELTYTFNLRDDYKWTNGETVTAKDFEYTFKALINPKFAAPYSYFGYVFTNATKYADYETYQMLKAKEKPEQADLDTLAALEKKYGGAPKEVKIEEVGIKATDDKTLVLTLENPTPYLLDMLAFGVFQPINQKAYEAQGTKYGTDAKGMEFNGAYALSEWAHDDQIVLTKNPNYPRANEIKIDKIVMKMIVDNNASLNSFKNGELDMIGLKAEQTSQVEAEGQPTLEYGDASTWYFEFNLKDKITSNEKIRRALTIGFNSDVFVKSVLNDNSSAAFQFVPPSIKGNKKNFGEEVGPQFSYNKEEAVKLLDEAKKELGVDEIVVDLLIDDGDTAAKHATFIQEMWRADLGVKCNITTVPFKTRLARLQSFDFQIVMAGWAPDYNDPMTFLDMFETGNGNNHTGYTNAEYDALLQKVREELDRDKRFGYLMDLEKMLMKDMPIGPYYNRVNTYTLSGKLSGVVRTAFQDFNFMWAEIAAPAAK